MGGLTKSSSTTTFVVVMLLLQVASTALLWFLNVLSAETTGVFSVLLAANFIAFAVILQVYRNPGSVEHATEAHDEPASSPTASTPQPAPNPAQSAPRSSEPTKDAVLAEGKVSEMPSYSALPRMIHLGIPIASFLILLVFAIVLFLPANMTTLPVESTFFFVPIYITIVVVLVFGSMYLFKRLVDTEESPTR